MTAPDFIEPLIGFRAWHLDPDGALVPWSLQGAGAWQPGVNTAVCHAGKRHRPPVDAQVATAARVLTLSGRSPSSRPSR
jgi:hypothetical protein